MVRHDEVLLIQVKTRSGRLVWTFPKGRREHGESMVEAALREVREETGYYCRALQALRPPTRYRFRDADTSIMKTVHWFLMSVTRKAGTYNPREVEATRWAPIQAAYDLLAYRSDKALLARADALRNGSARPGLSANGHRMPSPS